MKSYYHGFVESSSLVRTETSAFVTRILYAYSES